MAIAFVQGQFSTGSAGTTPQALPAFATNVAVGDLIVCLAGGDGGQVGNATSFSDNLGNTYTRVPSFDAGNTGGTLNLDAFYCRVTNAGACTITLVFNSANENCVIVAQHFNGFVGTATFDQKITSPNNASSTTCTSGTTGTLAQAVSLVVGLGLHASTVSAFSLGAGYTNLTQASIANRQAAMESKVTAATTATAATFSIAAARVSMGGALVFYDLVGGGGGAPVASPFHTRGQAVNRAGTY